MAAVKYKLAIEQGATFYVTFTRKNSDGTPVDLTGCTARMQVRTAINSPDVLLELTTENGRIVLGGAAGTVVLTVDAATTESIDWLYGVYDLEVVTASGFVRRLLYGAVSVSPGVTRND